MAGREARVFAEGSLRWTVASGTGLAWGTAATPATGLVGYVQAGANFTRTQTKQGIMDRGNANHIKNLGREFSTVTFSFLQAATASYPPTSTTSPGASLPQLHFEIRHDTPELGAPTAQFHQLINCAFQTDGWTENAEGNIYQQTWLVTNLLGPTASGYLSTGGQ